MADISIPEVGRTSEDILEDLRDARTRDIDWQGGKAFSLVYNADDHELETLLGEVAQMFLHENALNPFRYETLLRMEGEIVSMAKGLFGAGAAAVTSGGTESIFLAMQTARDHGRERGILAPKVLCTDTAHPAFAKACKYLDIEQVRLPHGPDGRAVPDNYAEAIDERVIALVVSTPCYPFGVIDPVTPIAKLAADNDLLCHVDACLGGWILPWWEKLGQDVPAWGFDVEGVTSMSADIHKYGYTFKGASTVLYRDKDLYQRQIFMYDDWPGGLYASSTSAGTRPGAPIAGAWTALTHLGESGYLRLTKRVLDATNRFAAGIRSIEGLHITSDPDMSLFEFGSKTFDINAICDQMDSRGWNLDRQQGGLHLMVAPGHDKVVDEFISDLRWATENHGESSGEAHVYGGVVD